MDNCCSIPTGRSPISPTSISQGQDSFTYRASGGLAPVIFNVDPARSSANINSSLGVSGIGSDSSSDSSKFSGTLRANLSPSSLPYNEIQIDDLNLRLDDDLRFRFRFAFGLAGVDADINGRSGIRFDEYSREPLRS